MFTHLLILALAFQSPEKVVAAKPDYEERILTGFTRARATMVVISEVSARCESLAGDLGDTIASQGVFASLDDTFTRLDLEVNGAKQEQARSRIIYLKKEVARYEDLLKQRTIPEANYDEVAQELEQAWLSLTELETQSKVLEERLARHQVSAPSGWRITERLIEPGAWVTAGSRVGAVGDFRSLVVRFHLDNEQFVAIQKARTGLTLRFPDLGLDEVQAKLLRFEPGFDEITRKRRVDLVIERGLPEMLGGLRCEWLLKGTTNKGRVRLPKAALSERFDTWWVMKEDGERIRVTLLGEGEDGLMRVASPLIHAGMRFRLEASE